MYQANQLSVIFSSILIAKFNAEKIVQNYTTCKETIQWLQSSQHCCFFMEDQLLIIYYIKIIILIVLPSLWMVQWIIHLCRIPSYTRGMLDMQLQFAELVLYLTINTKLHLLFPSVMVLLTSLPGSNIIKKLTEWWDLWCKVATNRFIFGYLMVIWNYWRTL